MSVSQKLSFPWAHILINTPKLSDPPIHIQSDSLPSILKNVKPPSPSNPNSPLSIDPLAHNSHALINTHGMQTRSKS